MSKLTKTPVLAGRAEDRPQPLAARPGWCLSGSMGSNWLYSADSLTDTLTRGSGPWSSRSMQVDGRPGVDLAAQAVDQLEVLVAATRRPPSR